MIIISPYAQKLRNGKENPKNYPYWEKLIKEISKTQHIIQVGLEGERKLVPDFRKGLSIPELRALLRKCKTWISCDSFFQHLGWDEGVPGIVLWSVSDPLIFGHPENINLLKNRDNLAPNQFFWWEMVEHRNDTFVEPEIVINSLSL